MPDWELFQKQHVLDPTVDRSYASWNQSNWNEFLERRLNSLGGSRPGFGQKKINSVIVGTPDSVKNAFRNPTHAYNKQDFYWSNNRFHTFVLTRSSQNSIPPYRVYNLQEKFICAKVDPDNDNSPVHFHGQADNRPSSGQLPNQFSSHPEIK